MISSTRRTCSLPPLQPDHTIPHLTASISPPTMTNTHTAADQEAHDAHHLAGCAWCDRLSLQTRVTDSLRHAPVKGAMHNPNGVSESKPEICLLASDGRFCFPSPLVSDDTKERIATDLEKQGYEVDDNYDVHPASKQEQTVSNEEHEHRGTLGASHGPCSTVGLTRFQSPRRSQGEL